VSGTTLQNQISDLEGPLQFIGLQPFNQRKIFGGVITSKLEESKKRGRHAT